MYNVHALHTEHFSRGYSCFAIHIVQKLTIGQLLHLCMYMYILLLLHKYN